MTRIAHTPRSRSRTTAPRQRPEPEAGFQRAVTDFASLCGWQWFHDADARLNHPGWPDLWLVRGGRLLAWELKTEAGQPSLEQCEVLEALQAVERFECQLLRPSDWPAIVGVLR